MAQIKKDTSLRKAILQAAITGQLISDIGGESDVLFSNEKKSKTKLDSEADLPLASRVSKRNSVVSDSERTTPSPRGYAPKTPNEFASFENQNSVSERSERPTLPETGKQLLDRIIEERNNKLLAEWEEKQTDLFASNDAHSKNAKTVRSEQIRLSKKIKKPEPIVASEIDEDEIPFEIPENWCWCRLGDVAEIKSSKRVFEKDYVLDGVPFFRSAEIGDLQQNKALKTELFISEKHFNELKNKYGVPQQGDLLITSVGTIGNTWISDGRDFYYKDGNITQISKNEFIIPEYFRLFIDSPIFTMQVFDTVAGTAYNALTIIKLKKLIFPLPPLAVQNAIVEKLEQVLPLVDAYENALLQKEELKNALPDKIKKAILQEAITGQLTESWRKSATIKESGKQLLDRIIEERNAKALAEWEETLKKNVGGKATLPSFASKTRAKKPVPVVASEIDEEDIPFEVPESWCWCRLGDICTKLVDGDHNPPAGLPTKTEYIMASSQNINNDSLVDLDKVRYLSKEVFEVENERTKAEKGDIFFTSVGTLGRSCVYDGSKNICFQRSVSVIKTEIYNKFFKYCLDAPFIQYFIIDNATGTAQKGFYLNQLAKLVIPLPPLEEQIEIVKKVEELLHLCK